jgi:hypothetical protein
MPSRHGGVIQEKGCTLHKEVINKMIELSRYHWGVLNQGDQEEQGNYLAHETDYVAQGISHATD